MMMLEEGDSESEEEDKEEIVPEPNQLSKRGEPEVSLHAIDGEKSLRTLKVLIYVNEQPVNILLDTKVSL